MLIQTIDTRSYTCLVISIVINLLVAGWKCYPTYLQFKVAFFMCFGEYLWKHLAKLMLVVESSLVSITGLCSQNFFNAKPFIQFIPNNGMEDFLKTNPGVSSVFNGTQMESGLGKYPIFI